MQIALENENVRIGQNNGQELAKNDLVRATRKGSRRPLKDRIRTDTEAYYGRTDAPAYVIRISYKGHRKYFPLTAEIGTSAKAAHNIRDHLRLHGCMPS
jgi:hypothetical protein